jgi:hypothetical protein
VEVSDHVSTANEACLQLIAAIDGEHGATVRQVTAELQAHRERGDVPDAHLVEKLTKAIGRAQQRRLERVTS